MFIMEPWSDPLPLKRIWCLWEVLSTVLHKAKFSVAMSLAQETSFLISLVRTLQPACDLTTSHRGWEGVSVLMRFLASCRVTQEEDFGVVLKAISTIDVGKAQAQEETDRIRILKVIEEKVGTSDLNRIVIGSLQGWLAETAKHRLMSLLKPERERSQLPYWLGCLLQQQGKLGEARNALPARLSAAHMGVDDALAPTTVSLSTSPHNRRRSIFARPRPRPSLTGIRQVVTAGPLCWLQPALSAGCCVSRRNCPRLRQSSASLPLSWLPAGLRRLTLGGAGSRCCGGSQIQTRRRGFSAPAAASQRAQRRPSTAWHACSGTWDADQRRRSWRRRRWICAACACTPFILKRAGFFWRYSEQI